MKYVALFPHRSHTRPFARSQVPLSERLSAFESQTSTGQLNAEQKQANLSADSLVTLLTQGLQSSDATLLDVRKTIAWISERERRKRCCIYHVSCTKLRLRFLVVGGLFDRRRRGWFR